MQGLQFHPGRERVAPAAAGAVALKETWQRVARRLKATLGEDLYSSWFARMEAETLDDGRLVLSVPTRFPLEAAEDRRSGTGRARFRASAGAHAGRCCRQAAGGGGCARPHP